ncbi:hypothetical protein ACGFNV_36705 [Streptomyces sp. NPDC048751]
MASPRSYVPSGLGVARGAGRWVFRAVRLANASVPRAVGHRVTRGG